MAKRYRNGWWLEQKYHHEGWTQAEIADECGVSPRTVRTYMNEFDIETRDVEGENHGLYGEERDDDVRSKIARSLEGREFSPETISKRAASQRGRELSETTKAKISESLSGIERPTATREKMSEATSGERNPNWRGGYSARYGAGWSTAREQALERDGCCQHCGEDGTEYRLGVHHIIPVRHFRLADHTSISDAHDLGNLVVLCNHCHPKADHGDITFESELEDPLCD